MLILELLEALVGFIELIATSPWWVSAVMIAAIVLAVWLIP